MARKEEAATDWRSQFQVSPAIFLVAAIGGGLLLGMATHHRKARPVPERKPQPAPEPLRRSLSWDWSDSIGVVKSVLIGIAITQAKKLLVNEMAQHRAAPQGEVPPDSTTH